MAINQNHNDFRKRRPIPESGDATSFVPNDDGRNDPLWSNVVIFLKDTNLDESMNDTLAFENAGAQYEWFMKHKRFDTSGKVTDLTNGYMETELQFEELTGCDYMMFQQNNFPTADPDTGNGNQIYYCFITNMVGGINSKNDTRVYFKIDPIQTYLFRWKWNNALIERLNVPRIVSSVDAPQLNTTDENLFTGFDYQTVATKPIDTKESSVGDINKVYCMVTTVNLKEWAKSGSSTSGAKLNNVGCMLNGVHVPLDIYMFAINGTDKTSNYMAEIQKLFAGDPKLTGKIIGSFQTDLITGVVVNGNDLSFTSDISAELLNPSPVNGHMYRVKNAVTQRQKAGSSFNLLSIAKPYIHGEPKLLMPPFYRMIVTDFEGDQQTLYPAYFSDMTSASFTQLSPLGYAPKYGAFPNAYLGAAKENFNQQYGVINTHVNEIPTSSNSGARYWQTMTQQVATSKQINNFDKGVAGVQGAVDTTGGLTQGIGSLATGNIGYGISGLTRGIDSAINAGKAQTMDTLKNKMLDSRGQDASMAPSTIGNMGGNPVFDNSVGNGGFYVMFQLPTPEYCERLANYFSAYGTKQQKIMNVRDAIFNQHNKHTYIQTKTNIITGSFNAEARAIINKCFNNGIRWWDADIGIGDISVEN